MMKKLGIVVMAGLFSISVAGLSFADEPKKPAPAPAAPATEKAPAKEEKKAKTAAKKKDEAKKEEAPKTAPAPTAATPAPKAPAGH